MITEIQILAKRFGISEEQVKKIIAQMIEEMRPQDRANKRKVEQLYDYNKILAFINIKDGSIKL